MGVIMSRGRFMIIQDPQCNHVDIFNERIDDFRKQYNLALNDIQVAYAGSNIDNILSCQLVKRTKTEPLQFDEALLESSLDQMFQAASIIKSKGRVECVHIFICVRPNEKFSIVNCVKNLAKKYGLPYSIIKVPFSAKFEELRPKTVSRIAKKKTKPQKANTNSNIAVKTSRSTLHKNNPSLSAKNVLRQLFPFAFAPVSKSRSEKNINKKLRIEQETSTLTNYIPTSDEITDLPFKITDEQQLFLDYAKQGNNVLIQSCVGGGKTTMLQQFVEYLPPNKNAIFLTFNKHLKIDILAQITNPKVWIANYHGLASRLLIDIGICGVNVEDLLTVAIEKSPPIPHYDVIVIDEFQDLDMECAKLLSMLVDGNPHAQIIVAGGMEQKNRQSSMLDAQEFIENILNTYKTVQFSMCWRLSPIFSERLSAFWGKTIVGMNPNMQSYVASVNEVVDILAKENPEDIMVIGNNNGIRTLIQNALEARCPEKYNKNTIHVSSNGFDPTLQQQKKNQAVFTNYDSCKGMERKVVAVADFTLKYFTTLQNGGTDPEIIRNLLCVAVSRASQKLIFVQDPTSEFISIEDFQTLSKPIVQQANVGTHNISSMLNTTYKESVAEIVKYLLIKKRNVQDTSKIELAAKKDFIDVNRLCGMFQEANFFSDYQLENNYLRCNVSSAELRYFRKQSLEKQILLLAAKETGQNRYNDMDSFVNPQAAATLNNRLHSLLNYNTQSQVFAQVHLNDEIVCNGYADAVSQDCVYELKYCNRIKPEYYVQCAMYMLALNLPKGLLWNTKDNTQIEIAINDKEAFKDAVIKALKKEKVEAQLINRTSNPLIAIVNPTKDNEYTIFVLNKTDGTILMEETKIVTMEEKPFSNYSINKIFVTQNINDLSLSKALTGYQVYNVEPLISEIKGVKMSPSEKVFNILQKGVDLAKYQYKTMAIE